MKTPLTTGLYVTVILLFSISSYAINFARGISFMVNISRKCPISKSKKMVKFTQYHLNVSTKLLLSLSYRPTKVPT